MLGINRARLRDAGHEASVRYIEANLFDRGPAAYDEVFFDFWLSHVPPERFKAFWGLVRPALRLGGRTYFVGSLDPETPDEKECRAKPAVLHDHLPGRRRAGVSNRLGLHEPAALARRLTELGWRLPVSTTKHLLYGFGEPLA